MGNSEFSTHGGQIGFSVIFEDDTSINEGMTSWDSLNPDKRIKELSISHLKYSHSFVKLKHYEWFFFENEAVEYGGSGIIFHTAKIFGGANPGNGAIELRLEFGPNSLAPQVKKYEYDWDYWTKEIRRRTTILRPGVPGSNIII